MATGAFLLFGLPFFLVGWILNVIPYEATAFFSKKIWIKNSFIGSIILAIGMVAFLVWYAILATAISWLFSTWWMGLVLIPPIYFLGIHALGYGKVFSVWRERAKIRTLRRRKQQELDALMLERKNIIAELEKFRVEYNEKVLPG